MDQNINEILRTIDFYYEILENLDILKKKDIGYMKKTFQACVFIENAISKIQEEKKENDFKSHLNVWMIKKKKNIIYSGFDLKNACDKILEFCLNKKQISNEIIDELLKMYILQCGSVRLESILNHILSNSMQSNTILQIFTNLEFSISDIEDEILINSWDHEIKIGNQLKVMEYLTDMFNKKYISKLIKLAYKSEKSSPVNISILNFFSKKLIKNQLLLFLELKNIKKKVLLKLLTDNSHFQVTFVDATFYFGRSMEYDQNGWITNRGFSYSDLKNIIKIFLQGSNELYLFIINRIKMAKDLDEVWEDIERDCIL